MKVTIVKKNITFILTLAPLVAVIAAVAMIVTINNDSTPRADVADCDRVGEIIGDNPDNLSLCDFPKCIAPVGGIANAPCYSPEGATYF